MTALWALATEAAALWGGEPVRLIVDRENAVFEMRLAGGARAALRLHRQGYQDDAAILSELWWCAALAKAGVPVPAALTTTGGGLLVLLSQGRRASAVGWLPGVPLGAAGLPLDMPPARAEALHHALGGLLAQMHDATDRLTLPRDFTRPAWDIPGLVGEAPFWGRFWEHPAADAGQRAVLVAARAFLAEWLSDHLAAGGDVGPIHADVLRENVLVDGEALSLIDFDDSGIGFRAYDLGTVMSQNLYEPACDALRDALIAGYGARRGISVEAVEVMTLMRTCASVGWTMPRLGPGDPVHARHLARAVMCAGAVMGRYD